MNWKNLGWQDITLEVPEDWCLHSEGGDWKSGSLRLDDGVMVTMELKWERSDKAADLDATLAGVRKQMKQFDKSIKHTDADAMSTVIKPRGFKYTLMTWEGAVNGIGFVARCKSCNTSLVLRLYWEPGSALENDVLSRIFSSIRDHLRADKMSFWSVYGLNVTIPGSYRLDFREFLSGRTQLAFIRDKSRIEFMRLSFGGMILEDEDLVAWFRRNHKFIKTLSGPDEQEIQGHDGKLFKTVQRRKKQGKGDMQVQSLLWYCDTNDKIHLVQSLSTNPRNIADVVEAAGRVACH